MNARYVTRRMRDKAGRSVGWGAYRPGPAGGLAVGYAGPLAWWRAHWSAASLNRPGR